MDELSLYILDITMNSVRAGATEILILLHEENGWLTFRVSDNGCGMTKEQLDRLSNPFFTTRKTRKVGLGIPFLKMLAEQTGGSVTVTSVSETESADHGTTTEAHFDMRHIDFIPLGNIVETVQTLIQGAPDINFTFRHEMPAGVVSLSCEELKAVLGEDISLSEPEILSWIGDELNEQYQILQTN